MCAKKLSYSDNDDYLLAAISHLALTERWSARSSDGMGQELSLDSARLKSVLEGFPGIFRKTAKPNEHGNFAYGLQMRWAMRKDPTLDENLQIPPLSNEQTRMLLDFVLHAKESENVNLRAWWSNVIAVALGFLALAVSIISSYCTD